MYICIICDNFYFSQFLYFHHITKRVGSYVSCRKEFKRMPTEGATDHVKIYMPISWMGLIKIITMYGNIVMLLLAVYCV